MRARGVLFLVSLAIVAPGIQAQQPPVVRGTVVGLDGLPVAGVPVRLEVLDTQQVIFQAEAVTDVDGSVLWDNLAVPTSTIARMAADFDGATYMSDAVPMSAGAEIALLATVAEVSAEGRPLHLDTLHIIIQVDEPGIYSVLQFMTVSNAGDMAWAGGPTLADGRRAGVIVPLPPGATAIRPAPFPTPSDALPPGEIQIDADRVLDPRPVPPTGRQVAVTYELDGGGEPVSILLRIPYPAQSVSVLVGGAAAAAIDVRDTNLTREDPQQIGDQQYELWTARAVAPDTEIRLTLAPPTDPISTPSLALVGLGVALLLAVAASLRGEAAPVGARQRANGLVRGVAALDDAHDAGTLETSDYFRQRAIALEQLMLLQDALTRAGESESPQDARGRV